MNTRRPLSCAMVVLCVGIFIVISVLFSPSFSWSSNGANVAGGSIGGGMILPNCGSGTVNISGGKAGNQTIGLSAGCNSSFDAIAWFKRSDPYTPTIPPGWQSMGTMSDCSSAIQALPGIGSFFFMQAADLNGQMIVNVVSPDPPPQICAWQDASKGGRLSVWDQAAHRVGNANAPIWAPNPPAQQAIDSEKKKDGDPVELATGLFIMEQIDLAIPDLIPLTLTRTIARMTRPHVPLALEPPIPMTSG
jgi:hypothetical protein